MPTVDFVYDSECPNVGAARANLMRALSAAGVEPRWREHLIGDPDLPERVRGFGSPTVLVDGRDVGGSSPGSEICCRIYDGVGVPSVETLSAALRASADEAGMHGDDDDAKISAPADAQMASGSRSRWSSTLAVLPGLGVALVPKLTCPLCWPAYAGILSATGLTFLMADRWLLPISAALLLAALGALAWRATARRGYGPALAGLVASVLILAGKFALGSEAIVYAGVAGLLVASVWNVWPRRRPTGCSACPQPSPTRPLTR